MSSYFNSNMLGLFQTYNTSSSNSLFNFNFTDYASIRSGAYKKLLNSYYNQSNDTSKNEAVSKLVNKTNATQLTSVRSAADALSESAKTLYTKGKDSAFENEEDRTSIDNAIKSFVDDYNDVIDAVDSTESADVLRKGINLANQTSAYSKNLAKVGITVNYDNTLSVDETVLKGADINDLKSLFSGVGSFAYQTASDAAQIGLAAKQQSSGTSLYGSNGSYNSYNFYSSIDAYL